MRTMFDAAFMPPSIPAGVSVAAGYVGAAPPAAHAWSLDDWRHAAALPGIRELVAIGVYAPGRSGLDDAREHTGAAVVVAAACGFGNASGNTIALDVEENVAAGSGGYVAAWSGEVRRLGFVPMVYTSAASAGAIAGPAALWLAHWTGTPHMLPGVAATQYVAQPTFDLSLVDDAMPLWSVKPAHEGETPVFVTIVPHPSGGGYWVMHANGGVFSYGAAKFHGSMYGQHMNAPITSAAAAPDGNGYWLLGGDGGVFSFGSAHFYGSPAK